MPNVDSLNISISATAQKASSSLDTVIGKLDRLSSSLTRINTGSLNNMSNGFERLGRAIGSINMSNIKAADFTRLATGIEKLGNIDSGRISSAAMAINNLGKSINTISGSGSTGAAQISDLAKGIAQLGYKSSTKAIDNIPKLAVAMRQLMGELSKAPKVSQNLIDMTNALANLARTGASSGKATTSLSRSLNLFSKSSKSAKTSAFSLASAFGKMYATYFLLFRAFRKIKEAMDLSSQLTEIQNVVDVTFGKATGVLEKFAETSITQYGISELAAKKTASTYQAMGTAMGFSQGKMANMSVELTKLSADMASFYNVAQEDVAEDLNAVFTGMTRPLRQYGLDLTNATLKEWALKNGMDADIKSMSQAEKTMLRYRYVLANTGVAQGDFARTQMTWSNQTRILVENFKAFGTVVGGMFTNAFKPLVIALNNVMGKLTQFAEVVSNSLGKIFGWQYQSSGGGIANDFEDSADSADDIADSTGKSAKNIDKMKKGLRAFDELKTISLETGDSDKGSKGSGAKGNGAGIGAGTGGQWTKVDSIFKNYESELDSFRKLGEYIAESITNGIASFDAGKFAQKLSNFVSGIMQFFTGFFDGLVKSETFEKIGQKIVDFICGIDYIDLIWNAGKLISAFGKALINAPIDLFQGIAETLIDKMFGVEVDLDQYKSIGHALRSALSSIFIGDGISFDEIFNFDFTKKLIANVENAFKNMIDSIKKGNIGHALVEVFNGILYSVASALAFPFEPLIDTFSEMWKNAKKWWTTNVKLPTIKSPAIDDISKTISTAWSKAKKWWSSKGSLSKISVSFPDIKKTAQSAWNSLKSWWNKNVKLKIPKLSFQVSYKEPSGTIQKAVVKALSLKGWPSLQFFATGGFPEDGTFRASHGEIMGRFDNGQTVVANNKQITDGISAAVYQGNKENNALLRQELELMRTQNELLSRILEKETGISSRDLFNSVRQSAREYNRMTGNPAFI